MNILITSASRKVGLVRAFQSALRRSGGGNVVALEVSPYAPALYAADRRFLVSPSNDEHFVAEVLTICKQENVELVIPTRDEDLLILAEAREQFEAARIRVMAPATKIVRTCADKLAFVAFCREHRFGLPRTYTGDEWQASDFPLFIKPRFGKGGQGARAIASAEELRIGAAHSEKWIIQEYVAWPEYTIDLLADFDSRVLSVVPRSRQLVVSGESYVSRTVDSPVLIAEATRLATELRLVGHNTIQCFWDGREVKFIEVNPRFGGAAALGIAAGADTPVMLVRMVMGETLPTQVGRFENDLVMLRFTDDIFLKASSLLSAGENRPEMADYSTKHPKKKPSNEGLQAVLFDLDNTLYPEEQFVLSGLRAAAEFLARRQNLDAEALLTRMAEILRSRGRGQIFNILLKELGIDSPPWLPTLLQVYRSHQPTLFLPAESATVLRQLRERGLRLGLVSDGLASTQQRKIAALGLDIYMDAIVCTGELGKHCAKPSSIPFEVALTLLNVPAEAAVYIADDISKDFAGPNQLRMKTVQIRTPGLVGVREKPLPEKPAFQPKMTAESLTEAVALLGFR